MSQFMSRVAWQCWHPCLLSRSEPISTDILEDSAKWGHSGAPEEECRFFGVFFFFFFFFFHFFLASLLIFRFCPTPVLSSLLWVCGHRTNAEHSLWEYFWNKIGWAWLLCTKCKRNLLIACFFFPRKVTFEKQWFYLDNAIGHSYGTTFEVTNGGSLQPKKKKEEPTSGAPLWVYEIDALQLAKSDL
jgi:hypothetical protein